MTSLPARHYRPEGPQRAVSYTWRDPQHLSAEQLAALEARDRPEPEPSRKGGTPPPSCTRGQVPRRTFAEARQAGLSIEAAAAAAGVKVKTARGWNLLLQAGTLLADQAQT